MLRERIHILLIAVACAAGAATAHCLAHGREGATARKAELGYDLIVMQDRAQLLLLLDGGNTDTVRRILETGLSEKVAAVDRLLQEGELPWAFPTWLGEYRQACEGAEAYARAHALDPQVAQHAHRICDQLAGRSGMK